MVTVPGQPFYATAGELLRVKFQSVRHPRHLSGNFLPYHGKTLVRLREGDVGVCITDETTSTGGLMFIRGHIVNIGGIAGPL